MLDDAIKAMERGKIGGLAIIILPDIHLVPCQMLAALLDPGAGIGLIAAPRVLPQ